MRPIIVVGMHRSGTSLIAELIDKWGAHGGADLFAADSRNPRGYWEYAPLVHFNRRLLQSVGSQSFIPPSDQNERTLRERASEPEWKVAATRLIREMEISGRSWYWKDPRLAVTLPFWQAFWVEPVYVIAIREALDTALSLKKRDNLPLTAGLLLWQRYMTAALKYTDQLPRRIFVKYENLLSSPQIECKRLSEFLLQHCARSATRANCSYEEVMVSAVNVSLRSNASQDQFLSSADVAESQKRLYRYLHACVDSPDEPLDPATLELYPAWRDYLEAVTALESMRSTQARRDQAILSRLQRKLSSEPAVDALPW